MSPQTPSFKDCFAPLYKRASFCLERGEGMWLFDTDGKRYLDFGSGIAVNALGHAHPVLLKAIADQAGRLVHASNLYHSLPMQNLAELLVETSFAKKVFLCNSGTEANEAALKFARKRSYAHGLKDKVEFVSFQKGFHGRTMGALSVTPTPAYRDPFAPLVPHVHVAELNDFESAEKLITAKTCAVIVEPIQGEGGIRPADPLFLLRLREWCNQHQATLIFDEVQCGLGRTGTLWAHEQLGVTPDILTSAKPLGAGLPCGAVLMTEEIASLLQPGDHGTTFGGNPVACAAGHASLQIISSPLFLDHIKETGKYLFESLKSVQKRYRELVLDVRGKGLMIGVELATDAAEVVQLCAQEGAIVLTSGASVLRLLPPLICQKSDVDEFISILSRVFSRIWEQKKQILTKATIREAEEKDIQQIFNLVHHYAGQGEMLPRSFESVEHALKTFFVAELRGQIVGCAAHHRWPDGTSEVRSLAVAPAAQGSGTGSALVERVARDAIALKSHTLFALTLRPDFFIQMGFQTVNRSLFPYKEGHDCLSCVFRANCKEIAVARPLVEK